MKGNSFVIFCGLLFLVTDSWSQNLPSVEIGNQIWTVKNLNVTTFRNGDLIPQAETPAEWQNAAKTGEPAWCYYENSADNGKTYGKLYNWYAVKDPRGLAPKGWRVPTDAEWSTMTKHLGEAGAGKTLKATTGWPQGKNGSNSSGMTILPGGCRNANGRFYGTTKLAYMWTSTENQSDSAWYRTISSDFDTIHRHGSLSKESGLAVRCIKE